MHFESPVKDRGSAAACLALAFGAALAGGLCLAAPSAVERAKEIDTRCIEIEAAGESALAAGQFDRATELFERLIGLRLESPFVDPAGSGLESRDDELPRDILRFLNNVEVMLYHRAVARKAFARWMAGDERGAENELVWGPRDTGVRSEMAPEQQQRRRRRLFSEQVSTLAGALFESGRWREAADAYGFARSQRLEANDNAYDDESARQQFNQAMAEYKDGRYRIARELLGELRLRMPGYRQQQVEQALANIPGP